MSFSEDPSSAAAPFSGDNSGQIFDLPDLVSSAPTSSERVVDTQSGFLVVVKKINQEISLFIKRQVGTPPSSFVPLTPDESIKLSRILSSSFSEDELESSEKTLARRNRKSRFISRETSESSTNTNPQLVVPDSSLTSVHVPMKLMLASVLRAFMVPIVGIVLSAFAFGIGAGVTGMKVAQKTQKAAAPLLIDALEKSKVEVFVRDFVAKMLDFSTDSYRISQVQAMAVMSPELLERYWQETRFPLSKKQLSQLPQGANILITQLKQERIDSSNVVVDVRAQLSDSANPKISTPVNLRLKLGVGNGGQIIILDQQDLSAASKQ